jgi:hypothetical protein
MKEGQDDMSDAELDDVVEPDVASEGYVLVMDDVVETWQWPSAAKDQGKFYISAKHPGLGEDKVKAASSPGFAVDVAKKTGDMRFAQATEAGFVEKCVQQIVDFAIPTPGDKPGNIEVLRFKPDNKGENYPNRKVYTALLRAPQIRADIEAFLDRVAGRNAEAQADFADLGEGPA